MRLIPIIAGALLLAAIVLALSGCQAACLADPQKVECHRDWTMWRFK